MFQLSAATKNKTFIISSSSSSSNEKERKNSPKWHLFVFIIVIIIRRRRRRQDVAGRWSCGKISLPSQLEGGKVVWLFVGCKQED